MPGACLAAAVVADDELAASSSTTSVVVLSLTFSSAASFSSAFLRRYLSNLGGRHSFRSSCASEYSRRRWCLVAMTNATMSLRAVSLPLWTLASPTAASVSACACGPGAPTPTQVLRARLREVAYLHRDVSFGDLTGGKLGILERTREAKSCLPSFQRLNALELRKLSRVSAHGVAIESPGESAHEQETDDDCQQRCGRVGEHERAREDLVDARQWSC